MLVLECHSNCYCCCFQVPQMGEGNSGCEIESQLAFVFGLGHAFDITTSQQREEECVVFGFARWTLSCCEDRLRMLVLETQRPSGLRSGHRSSQIPAICTISSTSQGQFKTCSLSLAASSENCLQEIQEIKDMFSCKLDRWKYCTNCLRMCMCVYVCNAMCAICLNFFLIHEKNYKSRKTLLFI